MPEFSKDYQPATRGTPEDLTEGRKNKKIMTDALMMALKREAKDSEGNPTTKLHRIADKLVDNAVDGDNTAIKEVFDRTDGRVTTPIEATIEGDVTFHWSKK